MTKTLRMVNFSVDRGVQEEKKVQFQVLLHKNAAVAGKF